MQSTLRELVQEWERDRARGRSFAARCEASEQLDALMLHEQDAALQLKAAGLVARLEAADARFFERIRARVRSGWYTPSGLAQGLGRYAAREDTLHGYAPLDVLLAGLLDAGELPEELPREAEMVFYQPAPGRVILSLLEEVRPSDTFYDIGAGLGRVVIMVALLRGVKAKGVENQPAFCDYAARAAASVRAQTAEFVAQDAREAALDDGTLFFLYTPFRGSMLHAVLAKLHGVAAQRHIRVCTFGPCTLEVAKEPWLALRRGAVVSDELAVFESVS
jgi:hypothetical protein